MVQVTRERALELLQSEEGLDESEAELQVNLMTALGSVVTICCNKYCLSEEPE